MSLFYNVKLNRMVLCYDYYYLVYFDRNVAIIYIFNVIFFFVLFMFYFTLFCENLLTTLTLVKDYSTSILC